MSSPKRTLVIVNPIQNRRSTAYVSHVWQRCRGAAPLKRPSTQTTSHARIFFDGMHGNGELAITPDLIRNAEGLRQGVIELRQVMDALRAEGCHKFGMLATSYGGWIGALLTLVESDFRFVALMSP